MAAGTRSQSAFGELLGRLQRAEEQLADVLRDAAERHRADHEIFHVAHDLERWSRQHVERLAAMRRARDLGAAPDPAATGSEEAPGGPLALVTDLRRIYVLARGVALDWALVEQYGHAKRDDEVVGLARSCADEASRQAEWALESARLGAPQVLTQS